MDSKLREDFLEGKADILEGKLNRKSLQARRNSYEIKAVPKSVFLKKKRPLSWHLIRKSGLSPTKPTEDWKQELRKPPGIITLEGAGTQNTFANTIHIAKPTGRAIRGPQSDDWISIEMNYTGGQIWYEKTGENIKPFLVEFSGDRAMAGGMHLLPMPWGTCWRNLTLEVEDRVKLRHTAWEPARQ